jgi:hypothetical protein
VRRQRRFLGAALCAAVLVVIAANGRDGGPALAQSPTAPAVQMETPPFPNPNACRCYSGSIPLRATATASSGRTIAGVAFQFHQPGDPAPPTPIQTLTGNRPLYQWEFGTTFPPPALDGLYDLLAVATDSTGEQSTAVLRDVVIANSWSVLELDDPGPALRDGLTLVARYEQVSSDPTEATFQVSRAGDEDWHDVGTDKELDLNDLSFSVKLDASTLTGGRYDVRAIFKSADDPAARYVARPLRDRLLDRDPPTATLRVPAGPLHDVVRLEATAHDDGQLASVRFERSPAGADSWTAISARTKEPYATDFDTRVLTDGAYDFRVVASDQAGNSATSPLIQGVAVANPGRVPPDEPAVTSLVAPASSLKLLGTTSSGETWAWGVASGPPPVVDGAALPYVHRGNQLVLLRYTEAGGWQIRDVLRDADTDDPVDVPANAKLIGQMTAAGEAWIAVRTSGGPGMLFHRVPGRDQGQFRLDPAASAEIGPLLTEADPGRGEKSLRLGLPPGGGPAFGVLVIPNQPEETQPAPGADGTPVQIKTALRYGLLDADGWHAKRVAVPTGYPAVAGDTLRLAFADLTGPGTGWVALDVTRGPGAAPVAPRLGRLADGAWTPLVTGLDVLDGTGEFADDPPELYAVGLRADQDGVWIGARTIQAPVRQLVARYDAAAQTVTGSWCDSFGRVSGCGAAFGNAAVPQRVFQTPAGPVGVALGSNFVHTYRYGEWTRSAAPGFTAGPGNALLTGPEDGWLAGGVAFGRLAAARLPDAMATWPQANRTTLLSVALPPGATAGVDEPGALAVGLDGTALGYDPGAGWQIQDTPARSNRLPLRSVAYAGPSSAFAVGGGGLILHWDGSAWSEDPQSTKLTGSELQSVAFDGAGQGWAVGRFATILHYDGSAWREDRPPQDDVDAGATISSVAVAGRDVYAISGGSLIERGGDGQWRQVPGSQLPDGADGDLRVVAGLPDGGAVVAGRSVVLVRQRAGAAFEYADQPIDGIAVAAAAFRDERGLVRAFVSVAPPVPQGATGLGGDVGGFPAGDGVLLRQNADGWVDLSHSQPPTKVANLTQLVGDGLIKPDPVLAVASSPDGRRAWVVGGYAGTRSAAGQGLDDVLPARPVGWRTAHIWRYDSGGAAQSPADVPVTVSPPAPAPNTVTFAYFSNIQCRAQCAGTEDAQPDVNLKAALDQIAASAQQPGGPAFAMLGGNARGPIDLTAFQSGAGETDLRRLPTLLAPLGKLPLFAAPGPRDHVVNRPDQMTPWADAFAQAPAPFGARPAPEAITPLASGGAVGAVHRYYAFDAAQGGSVIRVIVLDNSSQIADGPALDSEQSGWLDRQLEDVRATARPTIVVLGQPLNTATNSSQLDLALRLVDAGVLAVVVAGDTNDNRPWPPEVRPELRIPLIAGATLGYQQTRNNGVVWYAIAVDVVNRTVSVESRPIIDSLALKPLIGLTVARSQTLAFEAVGRRPTGTLATTPNEPSFPGFDNYVNVPAPQCDFCVLPGYAFESSDPTIGDFVLPSGPGSRYPRLDSEGRPIRARSSGLFCAFNSGSTTVSITVGTRRASLPVTVLAGGFGRPCGTVFREGQRPIVRVPSSQTVRTTTAPSGSGAPPPPPGQEPGGSPPASLPNISVPFPVPPLPPVPDRPSPPAPRVQPPAVAPPPPVENPPVPQPPPAVPNVPPVAVPPIPPNIQPIPPGGAASAQAAARRKEKVRKHASQSAFATHPPGEPWFYGGVGAMTVLTLLLIAGGVKPQPRRRPAPALLHVHSARRAGR